MIERNKVFIDGEWVDSAGEGVLTVVNPATEEAFATIPDGAPADVDRAARAAAAALDSWSQTTVEERAAVLTRITQILEARSDEITRMIVQEVGEPEKFAKRNQTGAPIFTLWNTIESMNDVHWDEQIGATLVHRAPAGVVSAITPWNVPMLMIAMKVGAALAAGCTVVLKGTEVAPMSSFIFAEAAQEAGVPAGVFNLVSGTGPVVGEAMCTHPLVDVVSLTGSVRAGRRVMELAAQGIKRVGLELGGKSANIILSDADLETAVKGGVDDSFRNSGQVCGGLTRMLVHRSRLAEAEEIAAEHAKTFILGDPFAEETTLGPVTTADALQRVRGYIRSGVEEGARLVSGGPEAPEGLDRGYFVRPTVFSAPDNHLRIAQEEIFGPVVTIVPFDTDDDAVRIANDSQYGLAGAIWAADTDRAIALAKRVRTGRVRINGSAINPKAPHGGFKLSGIGRENGKYGIEEFLEYQSIG